MKVFGWLYPLIIGIVAGYIIFEPWITTLTVEFGLKYGVAINAGVACAVGLINVLAVQVKRMRYPRTALQGQSPDSTEQSAPI
jgi:hypothetical protein